MATVQQNAVDEVLRRDGVREVIPYGDGEVHILWLSNLHPKARQRVLAVYGPTLADVERNLGVYIYYDRHQPEIHSTTELIEHAARPETLERLKAILAEEGTSVEKYHRVYDVLFGPRRVTYTQLSDVMNHVRQLHGVMVPNPMSWYFRFGGYLKFVESHLQWLRNRGLGRDLPEGEDVLLVEDPIDPAVIREIEASY